MTNKLQGGCLCGAVRYSAGADPVGTFVCHCTDCQKQSGSAFSIIVGVPAGSFEVTGDSVGVYDTIGDKSGKAVHRYFCTTCGSPVYTEAEVSTDAVYIKAGTLDDTSWLEPGGHIWTESAQPWVQTG